MVAAALIGATMTPATGSGANVPVAKPAPAVPPKATVAPVTFDSFRVLTERNIFNPNRVGRTIAGPAARPADDEIRLVGVLDSAQGLFAFFDGSDTAYRQALHEGGPIANFTVKHIGQDRVELSRNAASVTLHIGQRLHRPAGGDWSVAAAENINPTETISPASPAVPAIPVDASATLKRLMEQRRKQLQQ